MDTTLKSPHGGISQVRELDHLADHGSAVASRALTHLTDTAAAVSEATDATEDAVHAGIVHASHEIIKHHHPVLAALLRGFVSAVADGLAEGARPD